MCIENCHTELYADDTTVHKSGKCINDINNEMQQDLLKVETWCKTNNMFINTNKSKCMVIGTRQRLAGQNCELNLQIKF